MRSSEQSLSGGLPRSRGLGADGRPVLVRSWGARNAKGEPLTPDTIMYGASLTKTVFAYAVMQLVEEGKLSARDADDLLRARGRV